MSAAAAAVTFDQCRVLVRWLTKSTLLELLSCVLARRRKKGSATRAGNYANDYERRDVSPLAYAFAGKFPPTSSFQLHLYCCYCVSVAVISMSCRVVSTNHSEPHDKLAIVLTLIARATACRK